LLLLLLACTVTQEVLARRLDEAYCKAQADCPEDFGLTADQAEECAGFPGLPDGTFYLGTSAAEPPFPETVCMADRNACNDVVPEVSCSLCVLNETNVEACIEDLDVECGESRSSLNCQAVWMDDPSQPGICAACTAAVLDAAS